MLRKLFANAPGNRAIFLAILLLPSVIAAAAQIMDPFTFSTASLAYVDLKQGRVVVSPFLPIDDWRSHADGISARAAPSLMLATLSEVTLVPIETLIHLPIAGVAFALLAYAFAFTVTRSRTIALFYSLIQAWDAHVITATNNLFYIPLGFVIMLLFMTFYVKGLNSSKTSLRLMPLLVLPTLVLSYYASEFLGIGFVFLVYLCGAVAARRGTLRGPSLYLPLALAISASLFEIVLLAHWASVFSISKALDILGGYLHYLFGLSIRAAGELQQYAAGATTTPVMYISDLIYRGLLVLCVLAYLPRVLASFLRAQNPDSRQWQIRQQTNIVFLALILLVPAHILVYAFAGFLNLRAVYMFLPLLALLSLRDVTQRLSARAILRRLPTICGVFLILLVAVGFVGFLTIPSHPYAVGQYYETAPSIRFLADHSPSGQISKAVSNLEISGQLMFQTTTAGKPTMLTYWFGADSFILYSPDPNVVAQTLRDRQYGFLLLWRGFETRPVDTDGWQWTPAAVNSTRVMSTSPALNLIYQDSNVLIVCSNNN